MSDSDKWAMAKAEFEAGVSVLEISKRLGLHLAELIRRARTGGWKRGKSVRPPPGDADGREPRPQLPVVLLSTEANAAIEETVRETVDDIIAEHKAIARELRHQHRRELREYEAMLDVLATFKDKAHIARLAAKDDGGKELRQYLQQALVARWRPMALSARCLARTS